MHGRVTCVVGECMSGVCAWQGVCMAGGHAWWGVCVAGGVCGRGACMAGGHAWWGACVVEGCVVGGMCGGRYYEIWSMSGQYASYWNAFLLEMSSLLTSSFTMNTHLEGAISYHMLPFGIDLSKIHCIVENFNAILKIIKSIHLSLLICLG